MSFALGLIDIFPQYLACSDKEAMLDNHVLPLSLLDPIFLDPIFRSESFRSYIY
jgi:hypothetical protein